MTVAKVIRRKSASMDSFLSAKKHGRLLGSVDRYLQAQPRDDRSWKYLHPSEICKPDWCPRASWFVVVSDEPPPKERIGLNLQSIFDEGHLIHDKWQRWFWRMGNLYGEWYCQVCRSKWWATSPTFCTNIKCQSQLIKYAEVPLRNDAWLIAGQGDGWVRGIGEDCLIEIKSVGEGTVRSEAPWVLEECGNDMKVVWKTLRRPFTSHLRQAQIYLRVLHETPGISAPNEVVFIYEFKVNQQPKEFVVPYRSAFTDEIIEKAILVREHVQSGTPPKCPSGGCGRCQMYDAAA